MLLLIRIASQEASSSISVSVCLMCKGVMAAKSKAPKKARVAHVQRQKAKARGLQLTTAQRAAYNKAFAATAARLRNAARLRAFSRGFRKYRLAAAYATVRKYQASYRNAQAASVAAYATRRSWIQSKLAHQNSALQQRIEQDMYNHANLLGRAQFAQAGIRAYAHRAVMRTVTEVEAMTYETRFLRKVSQRFRNAGKSTLKSRKFKRTPLGASIAAQAKAAGLAAAKQAGTRQTRTGTRSQKQVTANAKTAGKRGRKAGKAPVKTPKTRTASNLSWAGDEDTPNCIVIAVANHLLCTKEQLTSATDIRELSEACGPKPTIEEVLWQVYLSGWPRDCRTRLRTYNPVDWQPAHELTGGFVIGYATEFGDHAALALPGSQVISWGSVIDREAPVEEAWDLQWGS